MRKRDPNRSIDQFQLEVKNARADWERIAKPIGAILARRATMDAFARVAVAFERYRADWHVAAICRDASRFAKGRESMLHHLLKNSDNENLTQYVKLSIPAHPTLEEVALLLDPAGGNLSIPNVERWAKMANRDLVDPWKSKVAGLSDAQRRTADAVIAIRNATAHQSVRATESMSSALLKLTQPEHLGLKRPSNGVTVAGIPSYLHGEVNGARRLELYLVLLNDLAESMRVP